MAEFYRPLPYTVEFEGKTYKLTPAFDNVLNMYEVIETADIYEQTELMFYYLLDKDAPRNIRLLEQVIDILIKPKKKAKAERKSFDFLQDGEYIYSAFMQAYHIDLVEQQGKLHWWKFNALLQGLPSDTRFMEIIKIRTQPLPKATKYNAEERAQLIRLKQEYALQISEEERQKNLQRGLRKVANILLSMVDNGKAEN